MKQPAKMIGIYGLLMCLINPNLLANPIAQEITTQYGLGTVSSIQNITLLPPKNSSSSTANVQPDYLFIDPGTQAVVIEPQPHRFTKEANTFKSHRLHYVAFWGIFFLMRGTQWGE